jgi:hypothetical protein
MRNKELFSPMIGDGRDFAMRVKIRRMELLIGRCKIDCRL